MTTIREIRQIIREEINRVISEDNQPGVQVFPFGSPIEMVKIITDLVHNKGLEARTSLSMNGSGSVVIAASDSKLLDDYVARASALRAEEAPASPERQPAPEAPAEHWVDRENRKARQRGKNVSAWS